MDKTLIDAATQRLVAVRRGQAVAVAALAEKGPSDRAEAYAVQASVARELALPIGGWKVGGPLDGQPMFAPIFAQDIHTLGSADVWAVDAAGPIGIECEIAFRLEADLPPRTRAYDVADVLAAVAAIVPAVETVAARIDDPMTTATYWKLADNQVNHGLIVGHAAGSFAPELWQQVAIKLVANERTIKSARGANPGGDSLGLLTWLANHMGEHCGGLKAGQVVTTGSYTGIDFFDPGTAVQADFGGLGRIALTI